MSRVLRWDSWSLEEREEFDPGQDTRLAHWNLFGNRILLKGKRERESC